MRAHPELQRLDGARLIVAVLDESNHLPGIFIIGLKNFKEKN